MIKVRQNLQKVVAIAICLAGFSVSNVLAQNDTTDQGVVINGVKWATRNVALPGTFAANPEDAGMFYQWNSKVGWTTIDPLLNSSGRTKWRHPWYGNNATSWEKVNDPCPTGWRMPTQQELQKLVDAGSKWTTVNGVEGNLFGSGSNTLFLPASGRRFDVNGRFNEGVKLKDGFYWSITRNNDDKERAYYLWFFGMRDSEGNRMFDVTVSNGGYKANGLSCRCVSE